MYRIVIIFMLFSIHGFAQQNYIVTLANDTLKGKVVRGNMHSNNLTLKTQKGKQKIHLREIKEWSNGKFPIVVYKDTTKKKETFYEYALEIDGKIKLVWDIHYDWVYVYSIYINNEYIPATPANMSGYIWTKLLQCRPFYDKYGKYSKEQAGELFSDKKPTALKEIIRYYNEHCERIFEYNINMMSNKTVPNNISDIKYIYRNQHLIREVKKRNTSLPIKYQINKDSVVFNEEKYRSLKEYCIENWQNYQEGVLCKHLSPLSANIYFENKETKIYAGYSPCQSTGLPKEFVAMQKILEEYFEPEKRITTLPSLPENR